MRSLIAGEITQKAQDDAARKKEEADRIADAIKKKALEDADRLASASKTNAPSVDTNLPPPSQPAPVSNSSIADLSAPWPKPPIPKPLRSSSDSPKGAEALFQSLRAVEIQKSTVGEFDQTGLLEAILVVRDIQFPNAPLQVLSWEIDGKVEKAGNAQYTVKLPVGTHKVTVNVVRATMKKKAEADVIVSEQQKQTTETNLQVIPLK